MFSGTQRREMTGESGVLFVKIDVALVSIVETRGVNRYLSTI